jgi:hypothetical protein
MKLLTTTALFTAMAISPALAQTGQPASQDRAQPAQTQTQPVQQRQATDLNFVQQQQPGQWSAEWLTNSNVYSPQNENIGTISDIILNADGSVEAVVIGVGGFLGIGRKDVAVNFDALEMRPAPGTTTTTGTGLRTDRPAEQRPPVGQPAPGQQATAPAADRQRPPAGQPTTGPRGTVPAADRQQPVVTDRRTDNLRIYINASREQLEAAPEYRLLESQEGGFFGGGSAR